jgi:peroxiredoxin
MQQYSAVIKRHTAVVPHYLGILFMLYMLAYPANTTAQGANPDTLDFSLKTIDGTDVRLEDYRGKKIVHLLFWATWCPHCLMEMPKVKELYHTLNSNTYEILAIDVGINDTLKRIRKIQQKYEIPCKILLDEKGDVTKKCKIVGVPCHIIIGKDGTILDRFNELPKDPRAYLNKYITPEDNL